MTMRSKSFDDDAAVVEAVSDLLRRFEALENPAAPASSAGAVGVGALEPAFLVAAADAAPETIKVAHFLCSGTNDEIEIMQALNALPEPTPVGGKTVGPRGVVQLSEGTFDCDGDLTLPGGTALLGRGKGTLIHGGDLRFLLNQECELGNFGYTESSARSGASAAIDAVGSPDELLIHDIYVFTLLSPTTDFIDLKSSNSGGRIWNIFMVEGNGRTTGLNLSGLFEVYDNTIDAIDDAIIIVTGDCYIYDNTFTNATEGISVNSVGANVVIGPNVYRSVTTPYRAFNDSQTRFTDVQEVWWSYPGLAVASTTGVERKYFGERGYIISASLGADTAGTGTGNNIIDVHLNGVTIFTTQTRRPELAAAANYSGLSTEPDLPKIAAGDFLTVDIDAVTASTAAEDLTIMVRYVELADL